MEVDPRGVGRVGLVAALWCAAALLFAPTAVAQEPLDITIRGVEFTPQGQTRVTVDLEGDEATNVDASSFTILEEGAAIGDVQVVSASDTADPAPRTAMLALDLSASTEGEPRERAIAAAAGFAEAVMAEGVQVGVVSFSVTAETVRTPTPIVGEVLAALDALEGAGGTSLYDGVTLAAKELADVEGQRSIIVFSDGADSRSKATVRSAATTASLAGAPITAVVLQTDEVDIDAMEVLAGDTGGRVIEVGGVGGLEGAFATVADSFNNQFVLSYPSTSATGQLELDVTLTAGSTSAKDTIPVLKPVARGAIERQDPTFRSIGPAGLFGNSSVGPAAVGVAALGVALLMWALFIPVSDRDVVRNLEVAIGTGDVATAGREELTPTTAAMSRRAIQLIERVPKPEGYDAGLQQRIDRAAWPLRGSEFTALRVIAVTVTFGLLWSLVNLALAFLAAAVAWVLPNVVLGLRVSARQKKFMDQLPDTLQLLSGSMKAGYGVLQAIDTVVKEAAEPTKSEFTRVLAEARLGLELDDSLMDMAQRVGTDDFRWVAVSISIQRRVGGNLAQLLETVAATLRERAATRRQIQALSAEGRLSAVILTALPFALGGYMMLVNPSYLSTLWSRGIGQVMVAGSLVLMLVGVFWMKNLIEIDV